jgi:CHAT domain-containing protein/tetratricopeptide (TPR) repeat protein
LELWQALGSASSTARTWLKLGDAKYSDDPSGAREAYEHALKICEDMNELRCIAEAANNSGLTARQLGDFNGSLNHLQEAARDWESLGLRVPQGKTFSNLGILYTYTGNFREAVNNYDQAIAILKKRDALAYARALNNLGLCYLAFAQYNRGADYFWQAITIEANLKGAEGDFFRTRMNYGRALMFEGKLDAARSVLEETLDLSKNRSDRNLRAFTLNNLGQTLLRMHQPDAAESRLRDALELHRMASDKRGEAVALHYLGVIARQRGDLAGARELLSRALQLRRDYQMRDDSADSLYELASLEFTAGESQRAAALATEAIPLLEAVRSHVPGAGMRASFYARKRNLLDLLVTIAMRPDNKDAAVDGLLAAELGRGRALLDILAERSSPSTTASSARQKEIRRQIDMLIKDATTAIRPEDFERKYALAKPRIQDLISEDEQLEADIRESLGNHEPGARPLSSVSALQSEVLSPRSAILEYQLGEQASHLWLIRDHQIEVFTLPSRAVIEKNVADAVGLFDKVNERLRDPAKQAAFHNAMRLLSHKLLGPLQSRSLPQFVILVLDGDLHRVPFAALQMPSGDYLGLHHDLLRAPSAAFLMQARAPRPLSAFPKAVIAFYDPVFSASDSRVPEAVRGPASSPGPARLAFGEELKTISALVPQERHDFFGGLDATYLKLRNTHLDRYAMIELSTHAVINDQAPEMSSIALSVVDRQGHPVSGLVLPYQLSGIPMNGSVVVLSACDTALGKKVLGEGMIGFTSSLFSAGASQLVLTLSEVNAEAASVFLSETYSHFLAPGSMSMEHSMTLARQALQQSDRWSDPYYWASFVEIGAPARMYRPQKSGSN